MSRIRSIHPGIWTDVDFVGLSPFARLLFIGMWNECDDKGIFLWSPLHLKMRILPADNVDAAALLDEIAAAGRIYQFDIGGKKYGAVKNFAKFQRPKKPNDIHPATPEAMAFAGHTDAPSAPPEEKPVRNQFPTGSEKSPQREDGGGRREEEPIGSSPPPPPKPKSKAPDKPSFVLPDWVPRPQWDAYLEMRAKKRAVPTDHAKSLIVGELEELRRAGHDPGRVLDQSTMKNWTGVFKLKDQDDDRRSEVDRRNPSRVSGPRDNRDGFERALDRRIFGSDDPSGRSAVGGDGSRRGLPAPGDDPLP